MKRNIKEPVITYIIFCVINYLFFNEDPAFISYRFHPYLFITILFAARYGIWEGTLSGVIGATLTLAAILSQSDFWETELLYGLKQLSLPFVLIILGVLIGENVENIKNKLNYFRSALQKESAHNKKIIETSKGLELSLLEIEKRFAGHKLGIGDFSGKLMDAFGLDREGTYQHAHNLFKKFLYVERSIILMSNPDFQHQKVLTSDGHAIPPEELEIIKSHELYNQVLHGGEVVSLTEKINDEKGNVKVKYPIYYAGPVYRSDNKIDAVVLITRIPFIHFNVTNLRLFEIILEATSTAITQKENYDELYKAAPYHHKWPVERQHYFLKNLDFVLQIQDKVQVSLLGFDFGEGINDYTKLGLMTLLSQLCVMDGVRVGYIEQVNCFAIYRELSTGEDIAKTIIGKFKSYGITENFAILKAATLFVTREQTKRENEHVISLFDAAFSKDLVQP